MKYIGQRGVGHGSCARTAVPTLLAAAGMLNWPAAAQCPKQWLPIGDLGMNEQVEALCVFNGELIAGGLFTIAGGQPSAYWARWGAITVPADLDCNGTVDGLDLALLLGAWGRCSGACTADLDGNGIINGIDLALLLAEWG